jgi:hypothetical protein
MIDEILNDLMQYVSQSSSTNRLKSQTYRCQKNPHSSRSDKQKATSNEMSFVLGKYRQRWQRWCTAGLHSITLCFDDDAYQQFQTDLLPS